MQRFILLVVAAAALFTATPLSGQSRLRNASRERRIEEALAAVAPAAVSAFRRATEALDSGRNAEAEPLFREVTAAAPEFTPAMRRLGAVLIELGRDGEGLPLLKQAVQVERSPENLSSLALGLAYRAGGNMGSIGERQTALGLAKEAARGNRDSDDDSYHALAAQIAIGLDDTGSFREAVEALTSKHPGTPATHYFAAIAAAMDGRWEQAEREIREAERLGLPHEAAERFLASGVHSRANVEVRALYGVPAGRVGSGLAGVVRRGTASLQQGAVVD